MIGLGDGGDVFDKLREVGREQGFGSSPELLFSRLHAGCPATGIKSRATGSSGFPSSHVRSQPAAHSLSDHSVSTCQQSTSHPYDDPPCPNSPHLHRYTNDPATELSVAAGEQMKITELRLAKLVGAVPSPANVAARRTGQLQAHLDPPGDLHCRCNYGAC